jgi:hypothetical protein
MIGDVKAKATIFGEVFPSVSIEGSIVAKDSVIGAIEAHTTLGDVTVGTVKIQHSEYPDYEGSYEVVPTKGAQSLDTTNKTMRDNLEIKAIPYYDVSNPYGRTIYIGGDLNA